jgi:DNA-binding transcriptional LysR family regulator
MDFTLRQLELFVLIAGHGSLSRAAAAIGLSQPAASAALAELERRSALRLFDRSGRRLDLSEAGRGLLPKAIELVDRARELGGLIRGAEMLGGLRVGATLTIGNYLIPGLVTEFWRCWPGAPVDVMTGNTSDMLAKVAAFEVDVALIEGRCEDPRLVVEDWLEDELLLFCAPNHPLARRTDPTIEDLMAERWIVREQGSGSRELLDRALHRWRDRWMIAIETDQIEAMLRFVALGELIGCASRLALRDDVAQGRLVELKVRNLAIVRRFGLVRRRGRYESAAVQAFLSLCRAAAAGAAPSHEVAIGKHQPRPI